MTITTITVCDTCRHPDGEKLHDGVSGGQALAALVEAAAEGRADLAVRRVSCLMGCERHCNIAVQAPGKLSYMLSHFAPDAEAAEAIVAYAQKHAQSESGQVPFREWPAGVKGKFAARIPPL